MQIKVKELTEGCMPEKIKQGDWIDLYTAEDVTVTKTLTQVLFPLGIAMQLPDGYEAIIEPRSSTIKRWGLVGITGIIDNSYCGDDDQWLFSALPVREVTVPKGTRLCQFRIQQKQVEVEFLKVETLGNENRGGFGSTGK